MTSPPTVLVTGATGLLGSMLTQQLVEEGASVRILRRDTSSLDLLGPAADEVEHAVGDLADPRSLMRAMDGIEQVYHVAAKIGEGGRDPSTLRAVNVQGTANVVNAALAADVDRLVHTSSIAALGRPVEPEAVLDETAAWRESPGTSDYAQSKYDAELEVHRGIAEGLDAVIVNPALIFGVGRPGENTRRIVDAVRHGWLPAVPPGGTNVVDAADVAAGQRAAMRRGETGERYILGSENLSWQEIIATLADAFGVDPPRRTIPPALLRTGAAVSEAIAFVTRTSPLLSRSRAESAVRHRSYDTTKARTELGYTFRPFAATARRIAGVMESA
jgi:dihydroflavonol-4-reductase